MTTLHPARRRAERFDALVEGGGRFEVNAEAAELLELVGALRAVPGAEARPEFVVSLREQLMVRAESDLKAVSSDPADAVRQRLTVTPRRTPRERRLAVALGGFAIVGATASMGVAAQSALPSDALYPVKRAMENIRAGVSTTDSAKGSRLLSDASGRLDEVKQLTDGQGDPQDIAATLGDFSDQASEASDLLMSDYQHTGNESSLVKLRDFTGTSITTLGDLEAVVPQDAHQALVDAAQTLFTIDVAAQQVCPTCAGAGITQIPTPLLASGGQELDQDQAIIAGGQIPGTEQGPGSKHHRASTGPSGIDPPKNPIQIPSGGVTVGPSTDPGSQVSTPSDPGAPGNPGNPGNPAHPGAPGNPGNPGNPVQSATNAVGNALGGGGGRGHKSKPGLPGSHQLHHVVHEVGHAVGGVIGGLGPKELGP